MGHDMTRTAAAACLDIMQGMQRLRDAPDQNPLAALERCAGKGRLLQRSEMISLSVEPTEE